MGSSGKSFSLILILIMAISSLSLLIVKPTFAQSIPSLSAPTFSVSFVDNSYNSSATYGIDPYTGKTVITEGGYFVQNKSIELSIKNQPFTPYTDANGNYVSMYYNISVKGHFGNDWYYYDTYQGYWYANDSYKFLEASNQSYTILVFDFDGNNDTSYEKPYCVNLVDFPDGSQVDFRVQAYVAYFTTASNPIIASPTYSPYRIVVNLVSESAWSNTQTVTIPESSTSASPSPTPTVPEFPTWIILPLFAVILLSIVFIRKRIPKK